MQIQELSAPGSGARAGHGTGSPSRGVPDRDEGGPAGMPGGCGPDPATRRRTALFGPLLRALRAMTGAGLEDTAELLGRDKSGVSRMETGQRGIGMDALGVILTGYGFGGAEYRSLMGAAHTPFRDWWAGYPPVLEGDFRAVALLELAAARIMAWQPAGVPELVQVPGWALAAARRNPQVPSGDEKRYAAAVAARQDAVLRGPYPAALDVILGSPVPAAAAPVPAAAGQAAALAAPPPGVRVRYAPAADSWLPSGGPFTILTFASGPVPAVVHLPGPGGGVLVSAPRTVSAYIALFQALDRSARLARRPAA